MNKNYLASIISFVFLLLLQSFSVSAQQSITYNHPDTPPAAEELMQWHETFTYDVHYSFFKLGEVEVEIISDTLYNGKTSRHLRTIITSKSGIPFVDEEENHYNSLFRVADNAFQVQEFWTDNVDEEEYRDSEYIFDRSKIKLIEQKVYAYEKDQPRDTLALEEPASSGHIIFYSGRLLAGTDSVVKIPIYLNREKKYMTITNTTETEMREYDAFPEEVETYFSKGKTDIDGPFGFSGAFESWYLADDLRVPLEARVKVWLGNAKIKLIDYKKERLKKYD
jgi:hypothetical protein